MGFQDHAVVDSGCSSHMTGNKAYLSEYEDLNGGFVAFGSDPKGDLKRKSKKVLIFESEEFMKKKLTDFVTPIKALGEAQEEDISPTSLEAAKTLTKVASQGVSKEKSTDKGKRYRRRARSMAKKIDTGLDAEEEINTGIEEVSTSSTKVDTDDWDVIRAKLKANTELSKDVLGKDLPEQDFAKRMVDMLKKLKFKEIKEEFDKLVQQIDTFVLINLEATKAKLKRYGEELQKKTLNKQRFDDKDVPAIGEKVAKSTQEDSETDKEESVEAMNPTPLTTKSDSVVNWKIFQQGQRSIYQIMRENGADTVYMSFGAMLKDFTREDLIELYRTMFDQPLNEDAIWSLPLQQKMVS
ncbi:hypothetical protein Tco_0593943 [Tanacetum coccineum]